MWNNTFTLEQLNQSGTNTLVEHLAIEFTDFGSESLTATMPVTAQHVQPYRILHGGASVVLAETMGSVASLLCISDRKKQMPVGIEINANHLKAVPEGSTVKAICKAVRVGRSLHVWAIKIYNEKEELTCISRLTVSIVPIRTK